MPPPWKRGPNFHAIFVKFCCEQDVSTRNCALITCSAETSRPFDFLRISISVCKGSWHRRGRQSGQSDKNLTAHHDTLRSWVNSNTALQPWQRTSQQNQISHVCYKIGISHRQKVTGAPQNWGTIHRLFVSHAADEWQPQLWRSWTAWLCLYTGSIRRPMNIFLLHIKTGGPSGNDILAGSLWVAGWRY